MYIMCTLQKKSVKLIFTLLVVFMYDHRGQNNVKSCSLYTSEKRCFFFFFFFFADFFF